MYVAAHVPKKLLGTVWEQQLLPGPSNWGDGGNVKELQAAWELPIPGAGLQLKLQ